MFTTSQSLRQKAPIFVTPHPFKKLSFTAGIALPYLLSAMVTQAAVINVTGNMSVDSTLTNTEYVIGTNGNLTLNSNANITGTTGSSTILVNANNANLTINSGAKITANGSGVNAVTVGAGKAVIGSDGNPDNVLLLANGNNANALWVDGASSEATINGATLRIEGPNTQRNITSGVALANNGGTLNIDNAAIQAAISPTGSGGFDGIMVREGSQATVKRTLIEILHNGAASGIAAEDNSSITIEDSQILMDHGDDYPQVGMLAHNSNIIAKNTMISMTSYLGAGIEIVGDFGGGGMSTIEGDGLNVSLTGEYSIGAIVGNNASVSLNDSNISALAAGSNGAILGGGDDPSELFLTDSKIQAETGIFAQGDLFFGSTAQFKMTMDHSEITSTDGHAISVDNAIGSFVITNNSIIRGGNGIALNVVNTVDDADFDQQTVVDVKVDHSQVYGDVITDLNTHGSVYGAIANVTLANNSLLQGKSVYASLISTDATSRWNMTDSSDVMMLTNSGIVAFSAPTSANYKTLTVHGDYAGTNGTFILNTHLGDDTSPSDQLIINGNSSGSSLLKIINTDNGQGALTNTGIKVVHVDGTSAGIFTLSGRVAAGAYEYGLHKAEDGNWYLRSEASGGGPKIRPEVGSYLGNMIAGSGMFMHTLHDRLGEPQYEDNYKNDDNREPTVWIRAVGSRTKTQTGYDQLNQKIDTSLVHFGGDLLRWSSDEKDRYQLGLMAAYGYSKTKSDSSLTGYQADGNVNGYSLGIYGTWYGNEKKPEGPYIDTWLQYGWYKNTVNGQNLPQEKYDSHGWIASIEGGYAFILKNTDHNRQWMIEPQLQLAYSSYDEDDHVEQGGTRVDSDGADGVITRLGTRLYNRSTLNDNGIQPFIELNWWHNSATGSLSFDNVSIDDGAPKNRYEAKLGVQGEVAKNWQMWGHISQQWGEQSYQRTEGMVGVKHLF